MTSKIKNNELNHNSNFWLGSNSDIIFDNLENKNITDKEKDRISLIRLVQVKRAVANFVKIVTGNDYPVKFATSDVSYTNGEEVIISSAALKENEFDATVGLALHEASHIKLSDFNILKEIDKYTPSYILEKAATTNERELILNRIKTIFGWIEDRRIDFYIYKTAPGYRGYYKMMYKRYFESPLIDEALKISEYRKENWESYLMHLINLTNPNRDLNALKKLSDIFKILDLKNIDRLKNSNDAFNLAVEIYLIIDEAVKSANEIDNNNSESTSQQTIEKIEKTIEKQVKFINGEIKKDKINIKNNRVIEIINNAKTDLEEVGKDNNNNGVKCIVVKNITQELIQENPFECFVSESVRPWIYSENIKTVENGIRLGIMLGKKLQVRNEERTTQFSRLERGKIDKRLVNSIGYGAENIFSQVKIDKFNPTHIHISVDASDSMDGQKWANTMTAVVAICKAASMVPNNSLTVSVDFRTTTYDAANMDSSSQNPLLLIAYDSRKDKFEKVRKIFPHIDCSGATPEGLCFEAISKFIKEDKNTEQFFINFSDGEPYFVARGFFYTKEFAVEHTAKQVKLMRDKGIKVLSFFINDDKDECNINEFDECASRPLENFKKMYGQSAKNVKVTELMFLAKSINEMFTVR